MFDRVGFTLFTYLGTNFALLVWVRVCVGFAVFLVFFAPWYPELFANYCFASLTSKRSSDRQRLELDRLQRKNKEVGVDVRDPSLQGDVAGLAGLHYILQKNESEVARSLHVVCMFVSRGFTKTWVG